MATSSPTDLFSDLPQTLATSILANAKPVKLAADEVLFLAGDPGDGCYRLNEGLLKVRMVAPTGAERILAILGPGSIVGDMAMIDGRPRSASVSALRDCKLSFVSRAAFEAVAEQSGNLQTSSQHARGATARYRSGRCGRIILAGQGSGRACIA